jgi:molybdopterin-guanine dinucleotide biosynthesis protein A/rhodanese-related sulfurtransferase
VGACTVLGVVLTGGRSSCMGHDKALLEVGGTAMAARVAAALRAGGADDVVAVGGDRDGLAGWGLEVVPDDHPGAGPLGGVLTALRHATRRGAATTVVLACDVPWPDPRLVQALVDALGAASDAPAAVARSGGLIEPLHSAWRTTVVDAVAAAFAAGERSPGRVLDRLGAVPVDVADPVAVADVDTPAALASVRDAESCRAKRHTGGMTDDATRAEITVDELAGRIEDAWILDVRQPEEYEDGHVPGAVLIPLDQLGDRHTEVPADTEVYVICKSGGRSAAAVDALGGAGYQATNVVGGTMAWVESGRPVVTGSDPR